MNLLKNVFNLGFKVIMLLFASLIFVTCTNNKNTDSTDEISSLADFSFDETSKIDDFYLGDLIKTGKINNTTYYIYSQRRLFDTFYKESKNLDSIAQRDLWIKTSFDKVGKSFFTDVANIEFPKENFDEQYSDMVYERLKFINKEDNYEQITEFTKAVENNIEQEVRKTIEYFGNVGKELYIVIYYVGANIANARLLQNNNQKPMFIVIAENFYNNRNKDNNENLDVNNQVKKELKNIIPHELAHNYQMTIQATSDKSLQERVQEVNNYVMLFFEGTGVYVQAKINKVDDTDYNAITTYDYSTVSKADIPILAKEFLTFYDKKAIDSQFEYWSDWLSSPREPIQGKMYPRAIGYFLGYWVTKDIVERQGVKLDDYLKLSETDNRVKELIYNALVYLSKQ